MATAEFALTLPAVVAVLVALLLCASAGINQVQATNAARVVVRALAAGQDTASATAAGARVAPAGATIQVQTGPQQVSCLVAKNLSPLGQWAPIPISAQATIPTETGYE